MLDSSRQWVTCHEAACDALVHNTNGEGDLGRGGTGQTLGQAQQLQEDRRRQPLELLHKDLPGGAERGEPADPSVYESLVGMRHAHAVQAVKKMQYCVKVCGARYAGWQR